ncbi:MAG: ester cyclase [Chloroflexi bacterium]|nr:MAG: ester cyclase [Chloroflexota bacterium]
MSSTRSILFIGAGILALVVLSVVVVLLVRRGPTTFPAGSPQAAMADYLTAWDDDDIEAAYSFLSDGVHEQVSLADYQQAVDQYGGYNQPNHQVTIDRVDGSGDSVTLRLTVEEFYGDGLSANVSRSPRSVRMVHQPDGWKIDEQLVWLDPGPFIQKGA